MTMKCYYNNCPYHGTKEGGEYPFCFEIECVASEEDLIKYGKARKRELYKKVGFTGTSEGMSVKQKVDFKQIIIDLQPEEFHHGDCVGADEEAHTIVKIQCSDTKIVIHPPILRTKRALCQPGKFGTILPSKEYLQRNRDIVDATNILLATPRQSLETRRSGTWATIRYARKERKPYTIIYPATGAEKDSYLTTKSMKSII